jgi:hypothetical protein
LHNDKAIPQPISLQLLIRTFFSSK